MPGTTPRGYPYPTYGDATAFATQIQSLATAIDTDIDSLWDRVAAGGNQPACVVESVGVNQSVANNTDVTATYATEVYDNASMFTIGTSTTNVNIVSTGIYVAMARVSWAAAAAAGGRQISVNSSTTGVVARRTISVQTVAASMSMVHVFFATSGSVITMVQRQNSGGAINSDTRRLAVARLGGI
jgi:hypothetical protein